MKNYFGIVHHDPGSAFGISFPDLPGCFAAADEKEDLMRNAIAAVDDYIADLDEAPEARDILAIAAENAEDLVGGAFILSVPYVPLTMKSVRANISLDRGLLDAIDDKAKELDMTRSAFIAHAALREIRQETA